MLAEKTGGVIINADSQQVYSDLPILTARPSPEDEARAPHKLYGILNADEACSAGKWLKLAKMEIDWALSQGARPIVTGGTGLYLKALLEGIADIPDIPGSVRQQAEQDYDHMGKESFMARLREIDPGFFARLSVYDRQRLIRAYSVWLGSGKTLTWWQERELTPPYAKELFEIQKIMPDRAALYRNCDARFLKMVEMGAVEEVRGFLATAPAPLGGIAKTIGLREFSDYLSGEIPLETAIATAQQATRNYAKRQMTWFRNQLP